MRLIAAFLVLVALVCGQEADKGEGKALKHPLTDMPGAAEDVQTASFFPDFPDLKLPIGEVVTSLCHFTNTGKASYNVSAVMASLNAPSDFRHYYQNYSYKPFGMVIKPGEEVTMKYTFQLHPDLEPVDYQLAVTVFYDSEAESFSNTYFNQTVELYLPTSEYDLETIVSVLGSLAATALAAAVVVFACFPESKVVIKATKLLRAMGRSEEEGDGWTQRQQQGQGQGRRKTPRSSSQ